MKKNNLEYDERVRSCVNLETGSYILDQPNHYFDLPLSECLAKHFEESTVIDVGCGDGRYTKHLIEKGITIWGYDGNPHTKQISKGLCNVFDFTTDATSLGVYDWVLCLEVGEHIPMKYENQFIQNLHNLNKNGIVLSWAIPHQKGLGHFNCRSNEYIKKRFTDLGYEIDESTETMFRKSSTLKWFNNTIMTFNKLGSS